MDQIDDTKQQAGLASLFGKIAFSANEARSVDDILHISLRCISETTGWPFGIACLINNSPPYKTLPVQYWYPESDSPQANEFIFNNLVDFLVQNGFIEKLVRGKKPVFIPDVHDFPDSGGKESGAERIFKSGILFPVRQKQEVVGFMGFFSNQDMTPDLSLQEVIVHICTQVGRVFDRLGAEKELQRYKHIVTASNLLLAFIDSSYTYRAVSQLYLATLNKSWNEIVGHTVKEVLGEELFENALKDNIDRCLNGEELNYQEWITFPDESSHYLDINYKPHWDFRGNVTGLVLSGHDMTEQKLAEDALRKSESLLRRYFDSGLIGMAIYSPKNGWLQINDSFCKFLGYTEKEMEDITWDDLSKYEDYKQDTDGSFELITWGKNGSIRDKRFVRKDGKAVYGNVSLETVYKDDGSVDYIIILLRDITDRIAANEALRKSEELLRSFFNAGYVGMAIITGDQKFQQVNDALCDIIGYNREEVSAMSIRELVQPGEREEIIELFGKVLSGNIDGFTTERNCVHKNGHNICISIAVECVRKNKSLVDYMVAFLQDITKRKQAETELYRYNRALNVLNQCNHTIVHATSGQQMINDICRIIIKHGNYRFSWVGYAKADINKTVYPVASAGHEAGYLDYCFDWKDDSKPFDPVSEAIRTGDIQTVKDLTTDPVYGSLRNAALERGYRSEIALPLKAGIRSFGALMIYSSEPEAFDTEEVQLLNSLAEDLAYGILSMYARTKNEYSDNISSESEFEFRALYDEHPAMLFVLDEQGKILTVNKFGAEELGFTVHELIGTPFSELSNKTYKRLTKSMLMSCLEGKEKTHHWEQQKKCKNGKKIWVMETFRLYINKSGNKSIFVVSEDITEIRKRSEQLSFQATHDSLTGLINRGEFENRMENILMSTQSDGSQHALCFLDLDKFKIVNDTSGHLAGDEMLRQIGMILQEQIRKRDTIARLGGDEFVILMEHCPLHRAEHVAKKLRKIISEFKFIWENNTFKVGVSIGIVPINSLSGNINDVLKSADAACYIAKNTGINSIHIHESDDADFKKQHGEMKWIAQIQRALERDQFQLFFQPIVSVRKTKYKRKYYEVLVRMKQEDSTLISPDAFMPVAERHNLSTRIDRWVIDNLFRLIRNIPEESRQKYQFSVNLSGHSLGDKELESFIEKKLDESANQQGTICFEITETAAIANLTNATRFMDLLRGKGCSFALDDFGSGLSSFAYLKNLHVDFLKIDGQFIKDIIEDSMSYAIVKSIHEIGHALGKKTVAEFVENKAIMEKLRAIGIDYAQGSYIGAEISYEELCDSSITNIIKFNKSR